MKTKINKWGNSPAARFPKKSLELSGLKMGDDLEIIVIPGSITLKKKTKKSLRDIAKPVFNTKDWKFDREEANARR